MILGSYKRLQPLFFIQRACPTHVLLMEIQIGRCPVRSARGLDQDAPSPCSGFLRYPHNKMFHDFVFGDNKLAPWKYNIIMYLVCLYLGCCNAGLVLTPSCCPFFERGRTWAISKLHFSLNHLLLFMLDTRLKGKADKSTDDGLLMNKTTSFSFMNG